MEAQSSNAKLKQQNPKIDPQVAVVVVPLPMQGHLNQLLHFSHRISSHGLPIHYVGSSSHIRQSKLRLHGWDPESTNKIHFHDFQLPPYDLTPDEPDHSLPLPAHFHPLFEAYMHLQRPISELLRQLSNTFRKIIVIHDIVMSSVVQDSRFIPNAESYVFVPISAFTLFLMFWENMTDKPFQLESKDIPEGVPSEEGCSRPEIISFLVNQFKFLGWFESGRIYNTSRLIESRYVELLKKISTKTHIKHFALGPLNPVKIKGSKEMQRHQCLEWLEEQEKDSVIYVSFGSSTSLNEEQIKELALGLEQSRKKFIWALKSADSGDIFATGQLRPPQLPQGYEERVKNRGIVVRDWAPQLDILSHPSTGGFMSHSGWNSCIESITMGVPILAWPMHSDQIRNTFLVTDILRVGALVRDWTDRAQLVTSSTIENAIRMLMDTKEGEGMRKRARELGDAVQQSVAKGGAASVEMESFIAHITR